jgi:Family of unknown function (DUF5335)
MAATRELARETWAEYFDALSRELLNAPVSIQVMSTPGLSVAEAAHLSLLALSYDPRDDASEVAAACGGPRLPSVLRHLVDHPACLQIAGRSRTDDDRRLRNRQRSHRDYDRARADRGMAGISRCG